MKNGTTIDVTNETNSWHGEARWLKNKEWLGISFLNEYDSGGCSLCKRNDPNVLAGDNKKITCIMAHDVGGVTDTKFNTVFTMPGRFLVC